MTHRHAINYRTSYLNIHVTNHTLQSYTTGSGTSPYDSLSPMDEVAALPSPTGGGVVVSTVAQVSSSATAEGGAGGMMQAAVSTSL